MLALILMLRVPKQEQIKACPRSKHLKNTSWGRSTMRTINNFRKIIVLMHKEPSAAQFSGFWHLKHVGIKPLYCLTCCFLDSLTFNLFNILLPHSLKKNKPLSIRVSIAAVSCNISIFYILDVDSAKFSYFILLLSLKKARVRRRGLNFHI